MAGVNPRDGDEDDVPEARVETPPPYVSGSIVHRIREDLARMVQQHAKEPGKGLMVDFMGWVPDKDLEEFLVLAIEYGAKKTRPRLKA